jgi:cysteine-rich repeat protein
VSGDGRFVGFDSDASNLVAGDVNGRTDVFVHDRLTGATERVSVASDGSEGNNRSGFVDPPALSHDGRFVAFTSGASNLVPDDTNNRVDVMLRDRLSGTTVRVNLAVDGAEADGSSTLWPNMSADGSVVVFSSSATNLVADDTNFVSDVFAYVDTCGNGTLEAGESCDDGNRADGDCCSSTCAVESAGSACDDGDLCTRTDACDDTGVCVGDDPVVCASGGSGQCGSAGSCDPSTGACVGGPAPDGTACDDGDACTVDDLCLDGTCEPGELEPSACVSSFQCYQSVSWRRPPWWSSSGKIVLEDRFETASFRWGSTDAVCSALSLPGDQSASRLACLGLRRASGSEKIRSVQVHNALGAHSLRVGKVKKLCLPAGATEPPVEPGLDGYKCHAASTKRFKPFTMHLEDEFGSGMVDVKEPELLCNPASVAGGVVEHDAVHLVCYRIQERRVWGRHSDLFRPRSGPVAHALGSDYVSLLWREHLCVPSLVSNR